MTNNQDCVLFPSCSKNHDIKPDSWHPDMLFHVQMLQISLTCPSCKSQKVDITEAVSKLAEVSLSKTQVCAISVLHKMSDSNFIGWCLNPHVPSQLWKIIKYLLKLCTLEQFGWICTFLEYFHFMLSEGNIGSTNYMTFKLLYLEADDMLSMFLSLSSFCWSFFGTFTGRFR